MSNPQFPGGMGEHRWSGESPRPLWGVLMVATALVAGMFIGRFLTKSEMRRDIVRFESQLSERQAEIDTLHSAATHEPTQPFELVRLRDQHRRLVTQFDELTLQFQTQEKMIGRAIQATEADQKICLDELRRYQQAGKPLSAENVLQFTERMFATRRRMLYLLAGDHGASVVATPARQARTLPQSAEATSSHEFTFVPDETADREFTSLAASATSPSPVRQPETPRFTFGGEEARPLRRLESHRESQQVSQPRLQPHSHGEPAGQVESVQTSGVFFAPPPPQRAGHSYFAPRQRTRVARSHRQSVVFIDPVDDGEGPRLR